MNKYLESGNSYYYNERHLSYKDNVVGVVPQIPLRSQLVEDVEQLFDAPTASVPLLELYQPQWLQGPHLLSILMKSCDLKLLSALDRQLFRFSNSKALSSQHDPVRGFGKFYIFAFQANQVARRVEVFYERILNEMHWDKSENQSWICDAYNPANDAIETLIVMPRHALLVANTLSAAMLLRCKQQVVAGFDWHGQRNSLAFVLISLVNPMRHVVPTEAVVDGRAMRAVILFLKTLIALPSNTTQIEYHCSFVCRMIEYICSR